MKRLIFAFYISITALPFVAGQMSEDVERKLTRIYNSGIVSLNNNDFQSAINSFSQALDIYNGHAISYLNRARAYASIGNIDMALKDLDQAIIYDPGLGEAYFYNAYFQLKTDTLYLVEDHLKKSIALGFEPPEVYYYLGLVVLEKGDSDKALIYFNKAINKKDDYALAYHDRAGIKMSQGDYSGALYDYKAAVNYRQDFPIAYNNMGSLKMILGDFTGANSDFNKAIDQSPEYFMAYNNLGYSYYQTGEIEKAIESFNKALEIKLDFMEARLNMASAYAKENKYQEAIEILDQMVINFPDEGLIFVNRGLIKELTGDIIGACDDWTKAKQHGEEEVEEYLKECK